MSEAGFCRAERTRKKKKKVMNSEDQDSIFPSVYQRELSLGSSVFSVVSIIVHWYCETILV